MKASNVTTTESTTESTDDSNNNNNNNNNEEYKLRISQLISLHKAAMPSSRIQKILGIDAIELSELENSEEFKKAELEEAKSDNQLDDTWDKIEKKALVNVALELTSNQDPLFALQVAKVANAASRRSRIVADRNAKPAVAAAINQYNQLNQSSSTTIINLDKRTLELLQSDSLGKVIKATIEENIPKKLESTASYTDAVNLLTPNKAKMVDVTNKLTNQLNSTQIVSNLINSGKKADLQSNKSKDQPLSDDLFPSTDLVLEF